MLIKKQANKQNFPMDKTKQKRRRNKKLKCNLVINFSSKMYQLQMRWHGRTWSNFTNTVRTFSSTIVFVSARRKALCLWLGVGLRTNWGGTMFLLILSKAKFIGYHLQGGGVWVVARPKKGF